MPSTHAVASPRSRQNGVYKTMTKKRERALHSMCSSTCWISYMFGFVTTALLYSILSFATFIPQPLSTTDHLIPSVVTKTIDKSQLFDDKGILPASFVSEFPDYCLPWPGEDSRVEGSHQGYRSLFFIQQSIKEARENTVIENKARMLCIWDLPSSSIVDPRQASTYMASHCQQIWILHERTLDTTLFESIPSVRLWDSSKSTHFLRALQQDTKHSNMDWVVIIPDGYHVIFELLEKQLSSLSPDSPVAVQGGLLTLPKDKPVQQSPDIVCPGWVFSASAVQQLVELPSLQRSNSVISLKGALLNALAQKNFPCMTEEELPVDKIPFTHIKYASFTHTRQWQRLLATLDGRCGRFWDTLVGAFDEKGEIGYVHDPTILKRPEYQLPLNMSLASCDDHRKWYNETRRALVKVEIAPEHPSKKKLFCMVYTHSNRHDQLRSIVETWGPRCDGFMAASNVTDVSLGAVNLWHEGPEAYNNMWLKVRSMWEYAHKHYLNDYDFFHIGGEDHYVVPENMRWLVATGSAKGSWDQSKPLYLGGSLAVGRHRRYCGGGSGYTLNRVALDVLITQLWNEPICHPHWRAPEEDVYLSRCFKNLPIQCMDTNDELEETRYHPWDAAYHANWNHRKKANWYPTLLERYQKITSKDGMGQISKNSVSFHLKQIKPDPTLPPDSGMRFYHSLLYGKYS